MKGFVRGITLGEVALSAPGVLVHTLVVEQLLAMKLCAWRDDVDIDDAMALLSLLAADRESVWRGVQLFLIPGRELKARYAFEDLWETRR